MSKGPTIYQNDFIKLKQDKELIAESITRIIMTNPGERVGLPFFGVGLRNLIFEEINELVSEELIERITRQCNTYEPRAKITTLDIIKDEEKNMINVKLGFTMVEETNVENENILTYSFSLE
jgi:phage baseplate assembly protein W